MRNAGSWTRCLLLVASTTFPAVILPPPAWAGGASLIQEVKHDVSPPLRELANAAKATSGGHQAPVAKPTGPEFTSSLPDPVAHVPSGAPVNVTVNVNSDGQSDDDNATFVGFPVVPPDTNGAVGADQFVQWVNLVYTVYDKATGARVLGPLPGNNFWLGFGGPCETHNDGDPIIEYDKAAGRWVAAQPVFSPPFMYCLAISTTSDATGSYNRYAFGFPAANDLPDYPKLGVWPDGYYASFNIFNGGSFAGAMACAYDRTNMLAGNPARPAICFQQPTSIGSLLPSDLDGKTLPPSGAPNFFLDIADSTHLNLFKFHVDFGNPANATFAGPSLISVAPFSELCARATNRSCIPEPSPGEKVDSLGDRLMYRLPYRNFGDHESLVVTHSIEGGALAGARWYEIRNPNSAPAVFQQGTVVDPSLDYWMGSIAMDHVGNIALGFSVSSDTVDPSVAIVGRTPTDQLGTMEAPLYLVDGTGVQVKSFKRWGDYSSMAIDPTDDCTFWYTQEHYRTTGSFNFTTRISPFKFPSCH